MSRPVIIATYWFASSSSNKTHETLVYADGTISCGCPGWTRRCDTAGNRSCTHTRMVEAGIGPDHAIKYNIHPDHLTTNTPPTYTTTPTPTRGKAKPQPNRPITLPAVGKRKFTDPV